MTKRKVTLHQLNKNKWQLILFLMLIFAGVIVILITISINQTITSLSTELQHIRNFCTEDDVLYQAILGRLDMWDEFFPLSYQASIFDLKQEFKVSGYRKFVAREDYFSSDRTLAIFVSVVPAWPNTQRGSKGYLYIPSGLPPSGDWQTKFDTTQLSSNIYCYEEKHTS